MSEENNITEQEQPQQTAAQMREILRIRRDKLVAMQQSGEDPFAHVKYDRTSNSAEILNNFDSMENQTVRIAGRIMSKRDMGKAFFIDIHDRSGKMQVYVRRDELGQENYAKFKKYDIGDIAGVEGFVFRTQKGEISVHAKEVTLLCKSLLPLPEKWHGLKDQDLRYRQRYVDLIVNPDVRETFRKRAQIISIIRREMDARGYMEVDTPILQNQPTNSAARPFKTHHNTLDIDMFMRVETELALKRLIVGGLEKVYEIGRLFRNEGMSVKHNPEFTSIEMYEAYTDLRGMMQLAEDLFSTIAKEVCGDYKVNYQGTEIDFTPPFARLTMIEAVKKYGGIDFDTLQTDEEATAAVKNAGFHPKEGMNRGELINFMFEETVEEHLIQPTFLCDYPVEISPLAKRTTYDNRLVERFELFAYGREMGNAYSELNDPFDQRERFMEQAKIKNAEGEFIFDEDFITAIEYGMPPTGGMGIGIDRMVMLFTDSSSIRDVLLFPTMKPMGD